MKQAIIMAGRAAARGDVPIGAVIVKDGKIIARGENQVQKKRDPTLHAEIVAIQRACRRMGEKVLFDCDMYVSLEPCEMCKTAIRYARIRRVFYAAPEEKGPHDFPTEFLSAPDSHASVMLKEFFQEIRIKNE